MSEKELTFKNNIKLSFIMAIYLTLCTLFIEGIGFLLQYLSEGEAHKYTNIIMVVFAGIIVFIWTMFLITILFSSKIVITGEEIKAVRFNKILWKFKKEEILECIYNELHLWHFIMPITAINAGSLQFKLQNGKISRHSCSLSKKQIDKIKINLDYPFRSIQTIYQQ